MDIETITKLIDAGYTKEEIEKFETVGGGNGAGAAGNEGAGNESAGNESAGNEGAGNESAGNESSQNLNTDAAIKALTDTVNALTNTVKAMQEHNANSATGGKPEKTGVDEVMKSFIDTL